MGDKPYGSDAKAFGSAMNQIAYGQAMLAAVKDYTKELEANENAAGREQVQQHDVAELMDDPELQKLHADRIAQLQQEREKRAKLQQQGHGTYTEITEGEFLEIVTKSERVVCHFFHRDFERCKIMDKHLSILARKYFDTRFIKLSAPDSPFFTVKLQIKMLPCVLSFLNGVAKDRVVGFDGLGATDDFETASLEDMLLSHGVIQVPKQDPNQLDDRLDGPGKSIRRSIHYAKTASDEDSDFD